MYILFAYFTKKYPKKVNLIDVFYKNKKNQKKSKKGIDNKKVMWYTNKAVAKRGSERSLKIEQQEISTKQKSKCENTNLVKRVYILNEVKEARTDSSKGYNSGKGLRYDINFSRV